MLRPNVTRLLFDPRLGAQEFEIKRRTGKWHGGRFTAEDEKLIRATGIIQPPTSEQLVFFPEGERREGQIVIWSTTIMHLTEGEDISDDVTWRGEQYKIIRIDRWTDYGYCAAYGQKR